VLGYIMADGIRVPVVRLQLRNSYIEITAERPGPVPKVTDAPVTVFGEDGIGIAQGSLISWHKVRDIDTLHVTVTFQLTRVEED
jgi:hypothetical protein